MKSRFSLMLLLFCAPCALAAAWCPSDWLKDCTADAVWRYLATTYSAKDCHNDGRTLVCQLASESRLRNDRVILQGDQLIFAATTSAVRDLGRGQDKAAIVQLERQGNALAESARRGLGSPSKEETRQDGLRAVSWWKGTTYFSVTSGWQGEAYYLMVDYQP